MARTLVARRRAGVGRCAGVLSLWRRRPVDADRSERSRDGRRRSARRSTSRWPPSARRASGRSRSSPHAVLERRRRPRRTPCADSPATAARWAGRLDEDFFLIVRVAGPAHAHAALRRHRGRRVGARPLGPRVPRPARARGRRRARCPAGDLDLARRPRACTPWTWRVLLDDFDLYPDEMLSDVARRLGFGAALRRGRRAHVCMSAA